MTVFEKARELGALVHETEQAKALEAAERAVMENPEAASFLEKYERFESDLRDSVQNGEMTGERINEASEALKGLWDNVKSNPVSAAYAEAANNFDMLIQQVLGIIQKEVWGDEFEDGDCGCGCGDCGGSCK